MTRIIIITFLIILTIAYFISTGLNADGRITPKSILGDVTYVDLTMIGVKDDTTQTTYSLPAPPDKLIGIKPGYRVEVKTENGRVLSITILGMPMRATPEPSQKWKVLVPAQ
jgi:hypothetical protein